MQYPIQVIFLLLLGTLAFLSIFLIQPPNHEIVTNENESKTTHDEAPDDIDELLV